jgi:hypothetical protein
MIAGGFEVPSYVSSFEQPAFGALSATFARTQSQRTIEPSRRIWASHP